MTHDNCGWNEDSVGNLNPTEKGIPFLKIIIKWFNLKLPSKSWRFNSAINKKHTAVRNWNWNSALLFCVSIIFWKAFLLKSVCCYLWFQSDFIKSMRNRKKSSRMKGDEEEVQKRIVNSHIFEWINFHHLFILVSMVFRLELNFFLFISFGLTWFAGELQ